MGAPKKNTNREIPKNTEADDDDDDDLETTPKKKVVDDDDDFDGPLDDLGFETYDDEDDDDY
ncbi:MAG: hypothetical protein V4619_11300 [Bacteroidota bacterium]